MMPRDYAAEAVRLWKEKGKQAAVDYITENCPEHWRRLAFTHARNKLWLEHHNGK